ncbi:MAG: regulatory protein RecX [Ignavibacteria bacterium]|nr:MAG: regulatory protein RecX [Ignavibacteria bacterium]
MKVTRIVKKDAKNVIVHFDNDEVLFLSVDIFYKSGLKKNDEISDDRFSSLIKENRLFHIKQRAFRYLGRRQHSISELYIKLKQKGYETEFINEVLDDLKKKDYLDDTKFAEMFVEEKIKLKLWGEQKLRNELIKRGINSEIISDILRNKISDEDKLNNALIIATKKYDILKNRNVDKDVIKRKLITFLSSRGYKYDVIKEVCDELIIEDDNYD